VEPYLSKNLIQKLTKLNLANIKQNNVIAMKQSIEQLKRERDIFRIPVSRIKIRVSGAPIFILGE